MHIAVDVYAGDPRGGERTHTTHCVIIFVAVNAQGNPTVVPNWSPLTDEDRSQEQYAKHLMELRKSIEEEMQQHLQ
jgi:acyl-CoA hydrolase